MKERMEVGCNVANNERVNTVKAYLEGLNEQQIAAVTAPCSNPVLVLAGAGCGKTTVLTRRILYLGTNDYKLKNILAITFTRKAAAEMAHRVSCSISGNSYDNLPTVVTFHAFALSVLVDEVDGKANFMRIGYSGKPKIISQQQRLSMLAEVSSAQERKELGCDLFTLDDFIAQQEVRSARLKLLSQSQQQILDSIDIRIKKRKMESNLWDYADLIKGVIELFSKHADVLQYYRDKYQAVLVDEFQDTNLLQIELLRYFYGIGAHIFAVGDDDQAIYGFRGADRDAILRFETIFPSALIFKLQINYRSTPAILECANRLLSKKSPKYRKELVSASYPKGNYSVPKKYFFKSRFEMIRWIYSEVLRLHQTQGAEVVDIAVLFRLNDSLDYAKQLYDAINEQKMELPQFLTVHSAKGLEFFAVFLCDLEETVFPYYRLIEEKNMGIGAWVRKLFFNRRVIDPSSDLEEELRLFYVGVTRAQKYLYFMSVKQICLYGKKIEIAPSRFLKLVK